jgi:hypothetical protein
MSETIMGDFARGVQTMKYDPPTGSTPMTHCDVLYDYLDHAQLLTLVRLADEVFRDAGTLDPDEIHEYYGGAANELRALLLKLRSLDMLP